MAGNKEKTAMKNSKWDAGTKALIVIEGTGRKQGKNVYKTMEEETDKNPPPPPCILLRFYFTVTAAPSVSPLMSGL